MTFGRLVLKRSHVFCFSSDMLDVTEVHRAERTPDSPFEHVRIEFERFTPRFTCTLRNPDLEKANNKSMAAFHLNLLF
jgi:hypothetical protein